MANLHILPLHYNPVPQPCSRSAWFLAGLCIGSLFVLALEGPSLFYNFFKFLFSLFYLGLDFYKSETGTIIVDCTKYLVLNYLDLCSTWELTEKMERGENMIPPLFTWILQDYPEIAVSIFERLDPIMTNKIYKKVSGKVLNFVCIKNNNFFKIFF